MLANFALFFGGGNNRNNGLGFIGSLAIMILAPLAAMLVQMAISCSREYAADHAGAEICGEPRWLASALQRISGAAQRIPNEAADRKRVAEGKSVSVRVDIGGRRIIKKKIKK